MAGDKSDDIEKVLGSPVQAEFSDELWKTKRNLLLFCSVTFFAKAAGVSLGNITLLGLSFTKPDKAPLDIAMLTITIYLFIQFCWLTWDYLQHNRLRVSGTKLKHVTVGKSGSHHGDYPEDPTQSTLYSWWVQQGPRVDGIKDTVETLKASASIIQEIREQATMDKYAVQRLEGAANEIQMKAQALDGKLQQLQQIFEAERIPVSLARFDKWFWNFRTSQVIRIWVLDIALPAVYGAAAIYVGIRDVFCP